MKRTVSKFEEQCRSRNNPKAKPTVPIVCFEATFSESTLTKLGAEAERKAEGAAQLNKENSSMKKYKVGKGYFLTKKIALHNRVTHRLTLANDNNSAEFL
jgi:hypothetical protein